VATIKQADVSALEIGKMLADRIHALVPDATVLLYGSAARGEMEEFSDIDIYVELPDSCDIESMQIRIGDIAWEIGFEHDRIIQAVVYKRSEVWDSPLRSSPFIKAIMREGVSI
jgi:predicted nucleotidyltransferase